MKKEGQNLPDLRVIGRGCVFGVRGEEFGRNGVHVDRMSPRYRDRLHLKYAGRCR